MNNLKVGCAKTDITPWMGISLRGYSVKRIVDGVLDPLEVCAVAITVKEKTILLIVADNAGITNDNVKMLKEMITKEISIPAENIIISGTHTHTAPFIDFIDDNEHIAAYRDFFALKVVAAAKMAIDDQKNAKLGYKVGKAADVAFVRRFKMKDGSVRTNPGVGNPDIAEPIGKVDEEVCVLRFDREGADSVVIVNFGNHPDVVGGCKISADWPGLLRRTLERAIPNTNVVFFNGAQGDLNHVNVFAKDGDMNDLENDFDDVARGYGHAQHIANVIAGAVMQVYSKVNYIDIDRLEVLEKEIDIPSNKPKPEDMPQARKYYELHKAGKDDEIPYRGMELTTVVAEARRMIELENAPDTFPMRMTGVALGDVGLITIPGEGFSCIGQGLKKADGYKFIVPLGLSNGYEGYFPNKEAYDEGGYESRSSIFKAGVAELFIEEGTKILSELKAMDE